MNEDLDRIQQTANPPYPDNPLQQAAESLEEHESEEFEELDHGEPSDDPGSPVEARRSTPRIWIAVLVASNLVFAGLLASRVMSGDPADEVRRVASQTASHLTNFDYRTIEKDTREISANATGEFAEQFEVALGGSETVFINAIKEAKGASTGEVHYTTVDVDGDNANAVVAITQSITNVRTTEPVKESRFMSMTLIRTASGWKVSKVELLLQGSGSVPPPAVDSAAE